jgi:hypothetical protein
VNFKFGSINILFLCITYILQIPIMVHLPDTASMILTVAMFVFNMLMRKLHIQFEGVFMIGLRIKFLTPNPDDSLVISIRNHVN